MAATGTPTPNLGLRIPVGTDPASVDDINYNSNLLDTVLGAVGNTSVKDQLDELSDQIANMFKVFTYTFNSVTISANSVATATATNVSSKPSGYSTIGARSIATGSVDVLIRGFDAGSGEIYLVNKSSSSVTTTPSMVAVLGLW